MPHFIMSQCVSDDEIWAYTVSAVSLWYRMVWISGWELNHARFRDVWRNSSSWCSLRSVFTISQLDVISPCCCFFIFSCRVCSRRFPGTERSCVGLREYRHGGAQEAREEDCGRSARTTMAVSQGRSQGECHMHLFLCWLTFHRGSALIYWFSWTEIFLVTIIVCADMAWLIQDRHWRAQDVKKIVAEVRNNNGTVSSMKRRWVPHTLVFVLRISRWLGTWHSGAHDLPEIFQVNLRPWQGFLRYSQ